MESFVPCMTMSHENDVYIDKLPDSHVLASHVLCDQNNNKRINHYVLNSCEFWCG